MKTYKVTWGSHESICTCENEADAWSEFCECHELAYRQPKLYERKIEEVTTDGASDSGKAKPAAKKPAAKESVRSG